MSKNSTHTPAQVTQTVRAGIECGDATGCVTPPDAPVLHLCFSRLRRKARLRLHALGQSDPRPAGRGARRARTGSRGRGDRERHGGGHAHRVPGAGGLTHRRPARLLRRHLSAVRCLAPARGAQRGVRRFRRRGGTRRRALAPDGARVDRDPEQPAAAHHRHREGRRARACGRGAGGGRQYLPVTRLAAAAHPRRGSGRALDHQVPQRPQ